MRVPVELIWNLVGDVFENIFDAESRRPIEAVWQAMGDMASDALSHVDGYKSLTSIFKTSPHSKWGTIHTSVREVSKNPNSTFISSSGSHLYLYTNSKPNDFGGYVRFNNRDIEYLSSSYEEIESGGGVAKLLLRHPVDIGVTPSSDFLSDRWLTQGSVPFDEGKFDIPGLNWAILKDKLYMDGKEDWSQIWLLTVDEWETDDAFKSISINSFSDSGVGFEVRVQNRNNRTEILSGSKALSRKINGLLSGNTITRSAGNFRRDGFRVGQIVDVSGTQNNDVGGVTITSVTSGTIEFDHTFTDESSSTITIEKPLTLIGYQEDAPHSVEFSLEYSSGSLKSKIIVDSNTYTQSEPFNVSPGRRTHSFDAFNESGDLSVILKNMIVTKGILWGVEAVDSNTFISDNYTHEYTTEEPIVESGDVAVEPWNFSVPIEITNNTKDLLTVEPDEDWFNYLPHRAFIGDAYCELVDGNVYKVISRGELSDITTPFHTDVQWLEQSTLASPFPLPRNLFIKDARAAEYDLHGRFGRLLGMPRRDDSQEYLASLRGMQAGLLSPPTEDNMVRGISILVGAPYAERSGIIKEIGDDYYIIGSKKFEVNNYWVDKMKPVGTFVENLEPLVEMVDVYDYITNQEEIERVVDGWKVWSTFLIKISSELGVTIESLRDINRYIRRVKNKRLDYKIEFFTKIKNLREIDISSGEKSTGVGYASSFEDMVFDDGGAVVNNDDNYEKQDDELYSGGYLGMGINLGGLLVRFKPKVVDGFYRKYISKTSVHLNRDLSQGEIEDGFTKKSLRFGDSGGLRPTETVRVLNPDGSLADFLT